LLIILEGADCAGKSTLAGRLVDRLRFADPDASVRYHHAGVPQLHPLEEYVEPLLDYRPGTGQHVVCDRWHLGESVYPGVLGRPTQLTPAVRAYVELFLRSRGAVLVYCAASYDYLRDCALGRVDDSPADVATIHDTLGSFRAALTGSLVPLVVEDVTGEHVTAAEHHRAVDATLDRVCALADRFDRASRPLVPYVTYVGPPRPALLLVGDRRGVPSTELEDHGSWPAFAPFPATSGDYLLGTLTSTDLRVPSHGVTLGDVGLVNANDVDRVDHCWVELGRPRVVALGVNAQRRLRSLGIPFDEARHPQYWRRFHYHQRDDYLGWLLGQPAVTA
jgi:hypothetical protein